MPTRWMVLDTPMKKTYFWHVILSNSWHIIRSLKAVTHSKHSSMQIKLKANFTFSLSNETMSWWILHFNFLLVDHIFSFFCYFHKQYNFIVLTACILNTTVKQGILNYSVYADRTLSLMCVNKVKIANVIKPGKNTMKVINALFLASVMHVLLVFSFLLKHSFIQIRQERKNRQPRSAIAIKTFVSASLEWWESLFFWGAVQGEY